MKAHNQEIKPNREDLRIRPPDEVLEAVILIERWTAMNTTREDWAIGGISCRKATERLMRENLALKNELKKYTS